MRKLAGLLLALACAFGPTFATAQPAGATQTDQGWWLVVNSPSGNNGYCGWTYGLATNDDNPPESYSSSTYGITEVYTGANGSCGSSVPTGTQVSLPADYIEVRNFTICYDALIVPSTWTAFDTGAWPNYANQGYAEWYNGAEGTSCGTDEPPGADTYPSDRSDTWSRFYVYPTGWTGWYKNTTHWINSQ